jgi:hypothetical protein
LQARRSANKLLTQALPLPSLRAKVSHAVLIAPAEAHSVAPQQPPQLLVPPEQSGGNAVDTVWYCILFPFLVVKGC